MRQAFLIGALASALGVATAYGHTSLRPSQNGASPREAAAARNVPADPMALGTVNISHAVRADNHLLNAGTYRVRLAGEPLKPVVGETPNLEQRVEFLQAGNIKGTAVATIVPPDQVRDVAKGLVPKPGHARVDVLKGKEYLRVWINKTGENYLIHLPMAAS